MEDKRKLLHVNIIHYAKGDKGGCGLNVYPPQVDTFYSLTLTLTRVYL